MPPRRSTGTEKHMRTWSHQPSLSGFTFQAKSEEYYRTPRNAPVIVLSIAVGASAREPTGSTTRRTASKTLLRGVTNVSPSLLLQ